VIFFTLFDEISKILFEYEKLKKSIVGIIFYKKFHTFNLIFCIGLSKFLKSNKNILEFFVDTKIKPDIIEYHSKLVTLLFKLIFLKFDKYL